MLCHVSDVVGVMDRAEDVGRAGERGRGRELGGQNMCL